MQGTPKRAGPVYLTTAAADVLTTPASGLLNLIRMIHLDNESNAAVPFSMFMGASGGSTGGTSLFYNTLIPANDTRDLPLYLVQKNTDYLSGNAGSNSAVAVTVMYDAIVVP